MSPLPQRHLPRPRTDVPISPQPGPSQSTRPGFLSLVPPGSKDFDSQGYIVSIWPPGTQNWSLTLQIHSKWALNSGSLAHPTPRRSYREGPEGTASRSWIPGGVRRQAEGSLPPKQPRPAWNGRFFQKVNCFSLLLRPILFTWMPRPFEEHGGIAVG